jgi:hypothetical protein
MLGPHWSVGLFNLDIVAIGSMDEDPLPPIKVQTPIHIRNEFICEFRAAARIGRNLGIF